jgi:hypothetical protein
MMAGNSQDYRMDAPGVDAGDKSEQLSKYQDRVAKAMKWRRNAHYDEKWARFIKLYGNQYEYPELTGYTDIVAPNMVFSTVNVIVPSIVVNYPKITVSARKPIDEDRAQIVEAVSNYNWVRYNVHEELKMMIKDFVLIGHGWGKVTWVLSEEEVELTRDEYAQAVQEALMQAQQAQVQAQKSGLDVTFPSEQEIIKSVPQKKTVVTADHPSVERISPFDIYVDPDSTRFKSARWIAQRRYVPISEAKENPDWDAAARKKLVGTAMSEAKKDYDLMFDGEDRGTTADFAVVWEYYDLLKKRVCTFAEGCDLWLVKPDEVPLPFDHPFVPAQNYIVPEKLYPIGDVEAIAPLQMELAMTRTQMINDRKRFRRMYLYKPDLIGPDGLAAITSGDDNAMIPVEGDVPFSEVLAPVGTSALPPEFYNQTAMILDDMNLVSGVTEYQRGSVAEVRRTATEASMIQDMSNARSADKLAIIESTISMLARRTVQLAQEFLTTEQVARIVGPEGAMQWVPYSREDITGEFDFQVEAGSTQPMNETFRRQSAMQLMDAMAPFVQMGVIDPHKLAEHVMRNGFGIKDPSGFMMAPPPPMPGQPPQSPGGPPAAGPPPGGMPPGM